MHRAPDIISNRNRKRSEMDHLYRAPNIVQKLYRMICHHINHSALKIPPINNIQPAIFLMIFMKSVLK